MSKPSSTSPPIRTSPCDVCRSQQAHLLFEARDRLGITEDAFEIAVCDGCGVRRTLPELCESALAKFYPQEYWGGVPTRAWIRRSQADKTDFVNACRLSGGRILDVGCGAGFFLSALEGEAWEKAGVEIGKEAAEAAEGLLQSRSIFRGTLRDARFPDAAFDVVTLWSSLEHTNEPGANLREARRILKPGGVLIVQVPNAAGYQAAFFKGGWFALDAPRHRYHFTPQSLRRLLDESGFQTFKTTFRSRAHNVHALRQSVKSKLWHRTALHRALFLLSIPFLKPVDFMLSSSEKGATMTFAARAI